MTNRLPPTRSQSLMLSRKEESIEDPDSDSEESIVGLDDEHENNASQKTTIKKHTGVSPFGTDGINNKKIFDFDSENTNKDDNDLPNPAEWFMTDKAREDYANSVDAAIIRQSNQKRREKIAKKIVENKGKSRWEHDPVTGNLICKQKLVGKDEFGKDKYEDKKSNAEKRKEKFDSFTRIIQKPIVKVKHLYRSLVPKKTGNTYYDKTDEADQRIEFGSNYQQGVMYGAWSPVTAIAAAPGGAILRLPFAAGDAFAAAESYFRGEAAAAKAEDTVFKQRNNWEGIQDKNADNEAFKRNLNGFLDATSATPKAPSTSDTAKNTQVRGEVTVAKDTGIQLITSPTTGVTGVIAATGAMGAAAGPVAVVVGPAMIVGGALDIHIAIKERKLRKDQVASAKQKLDKYKKLKAKYEEDLAELVKQHPELESQLVNDKRYLCILGGLMAQQERLIDQGKRELGYVIGRAIRGTGAIVTGATSIAAGGLAIAAAAGLTAVAAAAAATGIGAVVVGGVVGTAIAGAFSAKLIGRAKAANTSKWRQQNTAALARGAMSPKEFEEAAKAGKTIRVRTKQGAYVGGKRTFNGHEDGVVNMLTNEYVSTELMARVFKNAVEDEINPLKEKKSDADAIMDNLLQGLCSDVLEVDKIQPLEIQAVQTKVAFMIQDGKCPLDWIQSYFSRRVDVEFRTNGENARAPHASIFTDTFAKSILEVAAEKGNLPENITDKAVNLLNELQNAAEPDPEHPSTKTPEEIEDEISTLFETLPEFMRMRMGEEKYFREVKEKLFSHVDKTKFTSTMERFAKEVENPTLVSDAKAESGHVIECLQFFNQLKNNAAAAAA